ncbi:helix-turn-helix transcriptional regulator [Lachnospiraceae bacterium CLA-AA-H183]|uniref:helix-turn-helix domain-containing protein n=1 Tax=Simiaoa sp. TaxID=2944202 RepID=UPI0032D4EE4B
MDKIQMGTFIREQRAVLGLTQQQLAEQLHVTNKAVSRWETGNAYPDIALLDDLAAALSVSVEELCRGERMVLPSVDTNALLSDVICEARQQKKDRAAKWLRILCLSIFTVILLAFLFFTGAFYFIQNEVNLDEALFTLALGAFAIGLMLFRYGIPSLLLAIALPPLLRKRPRRLAETIVCILLSLLSVLWLIYGGRFLWLQLF